MSGPIPLVGRTADAQTAFTALAGAFRGSGGAVVLRGEPGIGKSRLAEEMAGRWESEGGAVLRGAAAQGAAEPFAPMRQALSGLLPASTFEQVAIAKFSEVFAVSRAGLLVAKSGSDEGEGIDADIFAGMFSAVQDFVKDSFERSGGAGGGLGRLEYGELKIIVEHGKDIYLTAVFRGAEHPAMKEAVRSATEAIGRDCADVLSDWDGNMESVRPVQSAVDRLAKNEFVIRQRLEGIDLDAERLRVAGAVADALAAASGEKPVLLLVEDVHWTDEGTLHALRHVARQARYAPFSVIATSRQEGRAGEALDAMAADGALDMTLDRLDDAAADDVARSMYPGLSLPDAVRQRLVSDCQGNPFLLVESLRQMAADGAVAASGGTYAFTGADYAVPKTAGELVDRRLEGLDPDAVALAEYASCLGTEFSENDALSLRTLKDPVGALDKLASASVIARGGGRLRFSHAFFSEVIYGGIGARWKAAYHRSIGEHLERGNAGDLDAVAYALAHHFARSPEHRKAFEYCRRAGEMAESSYAPDRALEHYGEALAALRRAGADPESDADLLERLGTLKSMTGDWAGAVADFDGARAQAPSPEQKARCLRRRANIEDNRGDYLASLATLEEARKLIEGGAAAESAVISVGVASANWHLGNFDAALAELASALELMRRSGAEGPAVADALRMMGNINYSKGDTASALALFKESLAASEASGDERGSARSLNNLGAVCWQKGELDAALGHFRKAAEIQERTRDAHNLAKALNNIGLALNDAGDPAGALDAHARSLAIKERLGDRQGVIDSTTNIAILRRDAGNFAEAGALFAKALEMSRSTGDRLSEAFCLLHLAVVARALGDAGAAMKRAQDGLVITSGIGAGNVEAQLKSVIAETLAEAGDHAQALAVANEALAKALELEARAEEGAVRRVLAEIYSRMGDHAAAHSEAEKALGAMRVIGDRTETGMAMLTLARVLGRAGDGRAAAAMAEAEAYCRDNALALPTATLAR